MSIQHLGRTNQPARSPLPKSTSRETPETTSGLPWPGAGHPTAGGTTRHACSNGPCPSAASRRRGSPRRRTPASSTRIVFATMLSIDYQSEAFPRAVLPNRQGRLTVTWGDILWAAVTVGRPDILHVFHHGDASVYEAIFRWSMVRMALEQRGAHGKRLVRTNALRNMDPTEKGAVSYFLGLMACKLFSWKLLNAPWTLHLDAFRAVLSPQLILGRSRPDLVAQAQASQAWYAYECKGRASPPGSTDKQKAKAQARRLVSVRGVNCALHVGAIMFFENNTLQFFWRDPEPVADEPIRLPDPASFWGAYYSPFVEAYRSFDRGRATVFGPHSARLNRTARLEPRNTPRCCLTAARRRLASSSSSRN